MKKLAVAGNPASHSKSPEIFRLLCKASDIKADYTRLSLKNAEDIFGFAERYSISGFNITSPFKEDVYRLLNNCDQAAKEVKAVNVIINTEAGYTGYNTDVYGIISTLKAHGVDPYRKKCVVAGSGGTAKASVIALKQLGAEIYISNRTDIKAENISSEYKCVFIKYQDIKEILRESYLFIPAVTESDPDICSKSPGLIIFEANYGNPAFKGTECAEYISGYEWLLNQALRSFELFFDVKAPRLELNDINKKYESKRIIALIGPTLSGKTSCAKELARLLSSEFYDSDREIEKFCRKDISRIFQEDGEEHFRQTEEKVIQEILSGRNNVLSIGAGAVQSDRTRKILSEKCFTILLDADPELSVSRTEKADIVKRPILNCGNVQERIRELFEQRRYNYFSAADLIVKADEPSAEAQAKIILRELNAR